MTTLRENGGLENLLSNCLKTSDTLNIILVLCMCRAENLFLHNLVIKTTMSCHIPSILSLKIIESCNYKGLKTFLRRRTWSFKCSRDLKVKTLIYTTALKNKIMWHHLQRYIDQKIMLSPNLKTVTIHTDSALGEIYVNWFRPLPPINLKLATCIISLTTNLPITHQQTEIGNYSTTQLPFNWWLR